MVAEGGEGENPLPFSLTAPKCGGGWGGGGRGGIPASFPSRSPPLKQPFQPTTTPRFGWFLWGKGPRPLVGRAPSPGGQPPGDLAHRFWGLDPATLTSCKPSFYLVASQSHGSKTLLGGVGWFPKAELYKPMFRLRSSISAAGPQAPGPQPTSPEPYIPPA